MKTIEEYKPYKADLLLWEEYVKQQEITFDYFKDKTYKHKGYDYITKVRIAMSSREVSELFLWWCHDKLLQIMREK